VPGSGVAAGCEVLGEELPPPQGTGMIGGAKNLPRLGGTMSVIGGGVKGISIEAFETMSGPGS